MEEDNATTFLDDGVGYSSNQNDMVRGGGGARRIDLGIPIILNNNPMEFCGNPKKNLWDSHLVQVDA